MEDFLREHKISSHLIQACKTLAFTTPTPVQAQCIPKILQRQSVRARAPTGTGKTAAFVIPIIELLSRDPFSVFALVLTPTRELGIQTEQQFNAFGNNMRIKTCTVVGGLDMMRQCNALVCQRPHIVIATPGRLAELLEYQEDIASLFRNLQFLVLDESDYLQTELQNELQRVINAIPECPVLQFSATMADAEDIGERASLKERFVLVPEAYKDVYLLRILSKFQEFQVIVFTDTCANAQFLSQVLEELDFAVLSLHSLLPQHVRMQNLQQFRSSAAGVLLATDVASRGLDMPQVKLVINHSVPRTSKSYVHRIGRTGRAGKEGTALTLVSQFEVELVLHIEKKLKTKLEEMFSEEEFFELEDDVLKWSNKVINAKAVVRHRLMRPSLDNRRSKKLLRKKLKSMKAGL